MPNDTLTTLTTLTILLSACTGATGEEYTVLRTWGVSMSGALVVRDYWTCTLQAGLAHSSSNQQPATSDQRP